MKIEVIFRPIDDPFAPLIVSLLGREFPSMHTGTESILDAVVSELVASKRFRFGPTPNPESLVLIRGIVRNCINKNLSIPILVPSGPKKTPNGESVDLAELSALRTLACLRNRVMIHYPPGVIFNVRLEDITGYYLEGGVPGTRESMETYIHDFSRLVSILEHDSFLRVIRENSLVSEDVFRTESDRIRPLILEYLQETNGWEESRFMQAHSWKRLQDNDWQGIISTNMREYYNQRFGRLFPEMNSQERLIHTARYLATTLARRRLNSSGADKDWGNDFLVINFAPPVSDAPGTINGRKLFYRSVPVDHTKTHLPFWRAKGIVKIEGNKARISLARWGEPLDYNECAVVLSNNDVRVSVKTDYVVCE